MSPLRPAGVGRHLAVCFRDRSHLLHATDSQPSRRTSALPRRWICPDLSGILCTHLTSAHHGARREHVGCLGRRQLSPAAAGNASPRVHRLGARLGAQLPPRDVRGLQSHTREAHGGAAVRLRYRDGAHLPAPGRISDPDPVTQGLRGGRRHRHARSAGRFAGHECGDRLGR